MGIEEGKTWKQTPSGIELMQGNGVIGTVLNKAYTQDRDYDNLDVKEGWLSRFLSKLSKKSLTGQQGAVSS